MKRPRRDGISSPLFEQDNGASPILGKQSTRIELSDTDSDDEVIINTQANKRRKMAGEDEMKVWFTA